MERILILLVTLLVTNAFGQGGMEPRPPRRVLSANELARVNSDTHVGGAQCYRNLTVFPLFTSGRATRGCWTLDRAMAKGVLCQRLNAPMVSQSAVWSEVARKAGAVAAAQPNETRYLGRIYEDKDVRREIDDYSRAIAWTEDANGMAVMIAGRVVGVEMFGDSETFARLRDKLLRSYAVDAIEFSGAAKPAADRSAVERFLQSARLARLSPKKTIGIGRLFGVDAPKMYGSVLVWHQQRGAHGVVHASLFEDSNPESRPPIILRPTPQPFLRDP